MFKWLASLLGGEKIARDNIPITVNEIDTIKQGELVSFEIELTLQCFKHGHLKSMVVLTSDINNPNLKVRCSHCNIVVNISKLIPPKMYSLKQHFFMDKLGVGFLSIVISDFEQRHSYNCITRKIWFNGKELNPDIKYSELIHQFKPTSVKEENHV